MYYIKKIKESGVIIMKSTMTGYASIDKPWLKYYPEGAENRPLPQKTLFQAVYEANKDHQSDYAFNYFGKRITYREFFYKVDTVSRSLTRLGVKPNDIVTIMGLSAPETFYVAYACNKIGAVINLISVLAGEQELVHYLNEARSEVFIALDLFNDKIIKALPQTGVKTVVNMSLAESMPLHIKAAFKLKTKVQKCDDFMSWQSFLALAEGQPKVRTFQFIPNRFSYLAHTGGTTGESKGVMLSDNAINGIAEEYNFIMPHNRKEKYLNTIVPFVVYGFVINAHMPLCLGLEQYIIPKVDPQRIPKLIVKNKINYFATVPQFIDQIPNDKRIKGADLSFLKLLGAGGDGMTEELESQINRILETQGSPTKLLNGYGLSETCATACAGTRCFHRAGSSGGPLTRNTISVFSCENQEMKYGETGEICIQTPYLMLGYLNNPEATDEVVKVHADGKKWFHTGDLGYITEEGAVYITGRIKRIILTEKDGMVSKIFPDRVEKLLNSKEEVEVSCVVQQPGGSAEVKLTANVVLKEQYRSESRRIEQELRELCAAELPAYSLPDKYVFRESMPLTAVGKIDFRALEREGGHVG